MVDRIKKEFEDDIQKYIDFTKKFKELCTGWRGPLRADEEFAKIRAESTAVGKRLAALYVEFEKAECSPTSHTLSPVSVGK